MKLFFYTIIITIISNIVYAQGFETDYSINFDNYYGYSDYQEKYRDMYKANTFNTSLNLYGRMSYEFNSDYKSSLVGYFMVDSVKEVENYNQGYWGQEVYLLNETSFGDISIGQNYNVAYQFAVGAPNVGQYSVNNSNIVNFINNPNWYNKDDNGSYKTLNSTYINTDGASAKISYVTPEFYGINIGATYIPKVNSQAGLVSSQAEYEGDGGYVLGGYGYWDISGYDLETSIGFADFENNDKEYSAGISVYRKGWTLGASYRKTKTSSRDYTIDEETLFDAYRNGYAYNVGISYEIGPIITGLSYFKSISDISKNENEIISFSNSYQYNKYVGLSFTASKLRAKGENDDVSNNNDGYAFILGLELSYD